MCADTHTQTHTHTHRHTHTDTHTDTHTQTHTDTHTDTHTHTQTHTQTHTHPLKNSQTLKGRLSSEIFQNKEIKVVTMYWTSSLYQAGQPREVDIIYPFFR